MNRALQHRLDLITLLTQKEIKVRYKNDILGYAWSVAQPLAMGLVFYLAFKIVMRIPMEDYALFLLAGLFPWQWFSNSINSAPTIFLANASIIKKVSFARELIPFTQVLQNLIHFLFALPVIVLFLFLYDRTPSWSWLYAFPALILTQVVFTYGCCLVISSVNLFFRDLERLVNVVTMLLFYVTPIIYPVDMVPAQYADLLNLNPLTPFIVAWRDVFLTGRLDPAALGLSLLWGVVAYALGRMVFRRLSWRFAEVL
jgi:lipopolysaccharide transport system permease protein